MESKTILTVICAWCGKDMGEKDGQGVSGVSHGMCPDCYSKAMADLRIAENIKDYWINQADGAE